MKKNITGIDIFMNDVFVMDFFSVFDPLRSIYSCAAGQINRFNDVIILNCD